MHTPKPLEVLSEGRSIIVSGGPNNDDIAEFFCADEATVKTTREEALAHAHRFAASERMLAALEGLLEAIGGEESTDIWCTEARAAIKAARGE